MTQQEVFSQITANHKWYVGKYSQGYATQLKQRFEDGRLSQRTIDKMFNEFGYAPSTPKQWVKVLDGKPGKIQTK